MPYDALRIKGFGFVQFQNISPFVFLRKHTLSTQTKGYNSNSEEIFYISHAYCMYHTYLKFILPLINCNFVSAFIFRIINLIRLTLYICFCFDFEVLMTGCKTLS